MFAFPIFTVEIAFYHVALGVILFAMVRRRWARTRLFRGVFVMGLIALVDHHYLVQRLFEPVKYYEWTILRYHTEQHYLLFEQATYAVQYTLVFLVFWLIDRNLFGVLFANLKKQRRQVNKAELEALAQAKALKVLSRQKYMRPFEPQPEHADQLCLQLGEAADLHSGISSRASFYIPERGVYTNSICFGSIGSAKTAGFLYPILNQLLSYAPDEPEKRIGGLVFDAKDDFSRQVRDYCVQYNREDDFMHLVVDGEYVCNPINDPDMSGQVVASLLTSLTSQVLGESKEAFWKGQYMVLTDNIANGLKVAFDYVNLLYFQPIITNQTTGEALIDYIKFLTGPDNTHEGQIFVYRNLVTNTDEPWTVYATAGAGEAEEGQNIKYIPLRGDVAFRFKTTVCHQDAFNQALVACPHSDEVIAQHLQAHILDELLNIGFGDAEEVREARNQLKVENAVYQELADLYQTFKRYMLNPSAPDRGDLFATILDLLQLGYEEESHQNPFSGTANPFGHDAYGGRPDQLFFYRVTATPLVNFLIDRLHLHSLRIDNNRILQSETFINWYQDSWVLGKDDELKGKIYGGLEAIINFFTEPKIMRTFAPSMVTYYDLLLNPLKNRRKLFPCFDYLMSEGKWLCVGIPKATYHRATDILCTLLKQQFQCAALQRTSPAKRRLYPDYNFDRMIALLIDEYHIFATVGDTQDADNNFFSLNRQSKVFAILATQTIENLKGKFKSPEYTSQLLGCCRNKVFLGVEDIETAEYASKMVGDGLVYRVSKSLGENQSDAPYSVFAGSYASEQAGLNQSLSFTQQVDRILRAKYFLELRSFSGVAVCYDGDQRFIVRLYLKPYWRDTREAFHWQVAEGILAKTKRL